ncbi:MAG: hypothetical protein PVI07_09100 [Anaerolineae bacterium]
MRVRILLPQPPHKPTPPWDGTRRTGIPFLQRLPGYGPTAPRQTVVVRPLTDQGQPDPPASLALDDDDRTAPILADVQPARLIQDHILNAVETAAKGDVTAASLDAAQAPPAIPRILLGDVQGEPAVAKTQPLGSQQVAGKQGTRPGVWIDAEDASVGDQPRRLIGHVQQPIGPHGDTRIARQGIGHDSRR